MCGLASTSPRRTATPKIVGAIPSKVPPPSGVLAQATRNKDGFFVNQKKKDFKKYLTVEGSGSEGETGNGVSSSPSRQNKRFVSRDGGFKRSPAIRGPIGTGAAKGSPDNEDYEEHPQDGYGANGDNNVVTIAQDSLLLPHPSASSSDGTLHQAGIAGKGVNHTPTAQSSLGMRRSFRYRKIALRKEYEMPLYTNREESESEDEGDTNSLYQTRSAVPGPQESFLGGGGSGYSNPTSINTSSSSSSLSERTKFHSLGNLNSVLESSSEFEHTSTTADGSSTKTETPVVVQRRTNLSHHNASTTSAMSIAGYSPANFYSKVTVTGPRRRSSSSSSTTEADAAVGVGRKKPLVYKRSNSQSAIDFKSKGNDRSSDSSSIFSPRNLEDGSSSILLPPPMFADGNELDCSSPSADGSLIVGLPARPPSDGFLYGSRHSLDNILVDPPDMFAPEGATTEGGTKRSSKRKLSRTRKVGNAGGASVSGGRRDSGKEASGKNGNRKPSKSHSHSGAGTGDRNSTESSDTGYTSSTSPGYSDQPRGQKEKMTFQDTLARQEKDEDLTPAAAMLGSAAVAAASEKKLRSAPSLSSLLSSSSDILKLYVPLVFHSPGVEGAGANPDSNLFSVQVCLVENSEELIKVSGWKMV